MNKQTNKQVIKKREIHNNVESEIYIRRGGGKSRVLERVGRWVIGYSDILPLHKLHALPTHIGEYRFNKRRAKKKQKRRRIHNIHGTWRRGYWSFVNASILFRFLWWPTFLLRLPPPFCFFPLFLMETTSGWMFTLCVYSMKQQQLNRRNGPRDWTSNKGANVEMYKLFMEEEEEND